MYIAVNYNIMNISTLSELIKYLEEQKALEIQASDDRLTILINRFLTGQ